MLKNRPFDLDALESASPFYDETHAEWRAQLRRFLQAEIVPHIDEWEEAGELPRSIHKTAAEFGLLQLGWLANWVGAQPAVAIVAIEGLIALALVAWIWPEIYAPQALPKDDPP